MSLTNKYWAEHDSTGCTVEQFLDKVGQGEYGQHSKSDVRQFLIEIEAGIISNIDTKAGEAPIFARMRDDVIAETVQRFRALREKYGE